jgi:hypothetical protein
MRVPRTYFGQECFDRAFDGGDVIEMFVQWL